MFGISRINLLDALHFGRILLIKKQRLFNFFSTVKHCRRLIFFCFYPKIACMWNLEWWNKSWVAFERFDVTRSKYRFLFQNCFIPTNYRRRWSHSPLTMRQSARQDPSIRVRGRNVCEQVLNTISWELWRVTLALIKIQTPRTSNSWLKRLDSPKEYSRYWDWFIWFISYGFLRMYRLERNFRNDEF